MIGVTAPGELMRAEILEQPARWNDLMTAGRESIDAAAHLIRAADPQLIVFAARGSSDHAAMYGQYLAHNLLGIPALLSTPSTVTAFGTQLRYPPSVMLAVSQSGESPDLLDTVRSAQAAGVPVVAFTNHDSSTLAGLATVHVPLLAGAELSVAATKTYTAELLALYLVLARAAHLDWASLTGTMHAAQAAASITLTDGAAAGARTAEAITSAERVLVIGRGYSMSTAKEGALKLMETCALAASGWSAADATHGPLGQVQPGTPVFALTGSPGGRDSVFDFAAAATKLGGRVIRVGPAGAAAYHELVPSASAWRDLDPAVIPLVEILPLQQLALELSLIRGANPDAPEGLNKVTKTT